MFVDNILQEFNTLFLIRFRTYKIATTPQTKTPVKTTFRDWCGVEGVEGFAMNSEGISGGREGGRGAL